jgi:hypothetical protein
LSSKSFLLILLLVVAFLAVIYFYNPTHAAVEEWREYLGGSERNHYSTLTQIDSLMSEAWKSRGNITRATAVRYNVIQS